jgi:transcriptional regulator with XRE-family HTH domain
VIRKTNAGTLVRPPKSPGQGQKSAAAFSRFRYTGQRERGQSVTDEDNSSITRRQIGRMLREDRDGIGLTLEDASGLMGCGKSTLQRYEKGQNKKVPTRELDAMIDIYRIDPERAEVLRALAKQAAEKSWWNEYDDLIPAKFDFYMGLESAAETLTTYQSDLVPGLLQTAKYASILAQISSPSDTDEERERRVQLKMRRQHLIARRTKPITLQVILSETVLRRMIGGPSVMVPQLKHLADISTLPNVSIRILPFSSGMPTGELIGTFVILDFPRDRWGKPIEPTLVYAENYTGDMYSEKVGILRRYTQAYERIQQAALDEVSSRALLRKIAREYHNAR